jgi:radical SAM superfamily enzyme YgiQ (UPF0313 family)
LRILLVNPGQLANAGEDQFAGRMDSLFFRAKPFTKTYFGIPLALPTLAGLTPPRHEVRILDEMVQPIDFDEGWDVVGISAMTCKATRAYQIADRFRRRGVPVVMGGIHASMCPDEAGRHVDCVVVGEAESLWTTVLEDLERGAMKPRYQADALPELTTSPVPRHDLTPCSRYFCYFLQTTRGCPRSCKFCTVTRINGRHHRKKGVNQVLAEVEAVLALPNPIRPMVVDRNQANRKRRVASGAIFFVDDNFAFDREHALDICRGLTELQDRKTIHLSWFTQCDVRTGFDDELLEAMKGAGCMNIFVGFESLSPTALAAMQKSVNAPDRYHACIENIERHGIEVTASVIVGTDSETARSGEEMASFVRENDIFYFFPNIMTPYPGTALMEEIEAEGRILRREPELYNIRNVVFRPKQMSPLELHTLFAELCGSCLAMDRLLETARAKLKRPKRYYLTVPWRIFIWLAFSLMFVAIALQRKIRLRDLAQLLRHAPRLILLDGSLAALGFVVSSVGFGTFSRSEVLRLARLLGSCR